MIGNNACGSRALGYGRTADNVRRRSDVASRARRGRPAARRRAGRRSSTRHLGARPHRVRPVRPAGLRLRAGAPAARERPRPRPLPGRHRGHPRRRPRGDRAAGARASRPAPGGARLSVDGRGRRRGAGAARAPADGAPGRLRGPRRADRRRGPRRGARRPALPRGAGWLFVEVAGPEAEPRWRGRGRRPARWTAASSPTPAEAAALWRIREDGAGLAARSLGTPGVRRLGGRRGPARAARRLPARLRRAARASTASTGCPTATSATAACTSGSTSPSTTGARRFRDFLTAARDRLRELRRLAVRRARRRPGPLRAAAADVLAEALALFARGQGDLRPRRPAQPRRPGRPGAARRRPAPGAAGRAGAHRAAAVSTTAASSATRCTAAPASASAWRRQPRGVMCPSYLATREEKDSTRGRARVLQEVVDGALVRRAGRPGGARGARPLPVLQGLRVRLPDRRRHGDLQGGGAAPDATPAAAGRAPTTRWAGCRGGRGWPRRWRRLANACCGAPGRAGGQGGGRRRPAPRRCPTFAAAARSARSRRRDRGRAGGGRRVGWVDTFTDHFSPDTAPRRSGCWRRPGSTVRVIDERGLLRADLDLHRPARRRRRILAAPSRRWRRRRRRACRSSGSSRPAGALRTTPWSCPTPAGRRVAAACARSPSCSSRRRLDAAGPAGIEVVAQPHCHHHAVLGWDADAALLARAGATVTAARRLLRPGRQLRRRAGHYEVSVAVAEQHLLPAVRAAAPDAVVLADGFSCRTQLADLAGARRCTSPSCWPLDCRHEPPLPPPGDPVDRPARRAARHLPARRRSIVPPTKVRKRQRAALPDAQMMAAIGARMHRHIVACLRHDVIRYRLLAFRWRRNCLWPCHDFQFPFHAALARRRM